MVSVAELVKRHPAFAGADSEYMELVLGEAAGYVDDAWLERDRAPAIMFAACHIMTIEGAVSGGINTAMTSGVMISDRLGDAQRGWAAASGSDFNTTAYGRQYLRLLRVNQPGVLTT